MSQCLPHVNDCKVIMHSYSQFGEELTWLVGDKISYTVIVCDLLPQEINYVYHNGVCKSGFLDAQICPHCETFIDCS